MSSVWIAYIVGLNKVLIYTVSLTFSRYKPVTPSKTLAHIVHSMNIPAEAVDEMERGMFFSLQTCLGWLVGKNKYWVTLGFPTNE